jgi:hypothetical protein
MKGEKPDTLSEPGRRRRNDGGDMEKKIGDVDKKWIRCTLRTVQILGWVLLTWLCVFTALHGDRLIIPGTGSLQVTFFLFPFLLLGALYGYVFSYISFMIAFVATLILSMDNAYNMAIYLMAVTCFAMFGQYFWFAGKKKTFLAALFTLLLTSLMEFACLTVLQAENYELSMFLHYGIYVVNDAVVIFGIAFLLHVFFSKAPDLWKLAFPIAIAYTKAYQENREIQRRVRKTRISVKITLIIIGIELILGISVACFVIALFPDMKDMMIHNARYGVEEAVTSGTDGTLTESIVGETEISEEDDELMREIRNLRFVFGAAAVVYDIKMILLMLCVGVPLGGLANFYTKMSIGGPLGNLSDFMDEFANADDDRKLEVAGRWTGSSSRAGMRSACCTDPPGPWSIPSRTILQGSKRNRNSRRNWKLQNRPAKQRAVSFPICPTRSVHPSTQCWE